MSLLSSRAARASSAPTRSRATSLFAPLLAVALAGCGGPAETGTGGSGGSGTAGSGGTGGSGGSTSSGGSGATGPAAQDILTTAIKLDLGTLTGTANISVQPAAGAKTVTFEVQGLTLDAVEIDGVTATYDIDGAGIASIDVPDSSGPVTLDIGYAFTERPNDGFDGWMPGSGVSFLWPYFCGNLFPCTSEPADGARFDMEVTGFDPSLTAVFPTTTTGDAPSYMPAVAIGDYDKLDLGMTTAGTKISAWYYKGEQAAAQDGTANLVAVFDFYEKTYGAYSFGPESGSVSADWGPGAYGGMEHHPFVHVARDAMSDEETHAHEAAHGWFGDGIRIACWEDFVLSEGTVTYMAAHALEEVGGPVIWPSYVSVLDDICSGNDVNTIALPDTCNEIDLLNDDLWSSVPYMKGACFYEDVADAIGAAKLDGVLSTSTRPMSAAPRPCAT